MSKITKFLKEGIIKSVKAFVCALPNVVFDIVVLMAIASCFFAFKDDISIQSPTDLSHFNSGVYLISYADGSDIFFQNQNTLAYSALNKGINFILNYKRSHLDPQFAKDHASVLQQKKGAGLWLWKPWIILHTLEKVPENAIVIYADSGIVFHSPLHDLLKLVQDKDMVLTGDDPEQILETNTKREAFIRLGCDTPEFRGAKVVGASFFVIRNTPSARNFIKKWLNTCTMSEDMMNDKKSTLPEHPGFQGHLPEQSILGILYHKDPARKLVITDKVALRYISWPHRHPNSYRQFHAVMEGPASEHDSLLPYMQPNKAYFVIEESLLNNWVSIRLRKFLH